MFSFTVSLFTTLIVVAATYGMINWTRRAATGDKAAIMGLYLLFGMPGVLLTVAGAALLTNRQEGGLTALAMGLGLSLPLLSPVRRAFAAITPMDADSPTDWSGLAILLAMFGFLGTALLAEPEASLTEGLGTSDLMQGLVVSLITFVLMAYMAVGYRNFRDGEQATTRLGIQRPTPLQIGVGLAGVVACLVCAMVGSLLMQALQPDQVDSLRETMQRMTNGVTNPFIAVFLGLFSGIGEEVFFRGALQPRYGMVLVSLVWTASHAQYGFTWVLLGLFLMGLVLGWIRNRYGTTAAIITHVAYNILVVLLQSII